MMLDAAYRRPPFHPGEKEKGFRDALIMEAFLQLVTASPVTPKVCHIALVTGDGLLADAIKARTSDSKNVRILTTLEELKGLISTLVSAVSEEFVAGLQERAGKYFFNPDHVEESLISKEKVRDRIRENFGSELESIPKGAERRENGTWYVTPPRFARKERQRVYWVTRINVEAKAYKTVLPGFAELWTQLAPLLLPKTPQSGPGGYLTGIPTISTHGGQPQLGSGKREELFAKGRSSFEIGWSIVVTTTRKFTSPRVEGIQHIETTWEQ